MGTDDFEPWRRHLDTDTKSRTSEEREPRPVRVPSLTVLCHGDPSRAGEQAWLTDLAEGRGMDLSRLAPMFRAPGSEEGRPLAEPRMSRRPIRLTPRPEGLLIDASGSPTAVELDGEALDGRRLISRPELEQGVGLLLGGRVTLWLQSLTPVVQRPPSFGLVGESPALVQVRRRIEAVADLDMPVLLRGESGTGKELAARAIQAGSRRRGKPFLTLNMAAVPPTLAASELFGAAKGAYSGADRQRPGFFRRADGGTLFLDEIGETPEEVQSLLLRALESGEIQPVGAEKALQVDVRVIAATDVDLEEGIRRGTFKESLLYRLSSYEIVLPPLRRRLDDLGRLFFHFLRQELERIGREERLVSHGPYDRPFVPASLLAHMVRHPWPGNVRELRNAVRHLVVASREAETLQVGEWLDRVGVEEPARRVLAEDSREPSPTTIPSPRPDSTTRYRDPSDVGEDELVSTLREHRWNLKATAEALGVSRGSLYGLVEDSPRIRKAADLERAEIEQAIERLGESFDKLAEDLEVSKQGLKRRMTELGID